MRLAQAPLSTGVSRDLVEAKSRLRDRLVRSPEESALRAMALRKAKRFEPRPDVNLVGVGIGEKVTAGKRTGLLALKVLVAKKYPKRRISRSDLLPTAFDGMPLDVEGVGYARKFPIPQRGRHRPVIGGISLGLELDEVGYRFAGTLGAVVVDRDKGRTLYALSNNHVLADENRARRAADVVQPGTLEGVAAGNRIGTLSRCEPLVFANRRNWMDAALARFNRGVAARAAILGIGPPTGAGAPRLHQLVRKSGRTTGLTEGVIRAVRFDVFNIEYDQGMVRMDDVVVIEGVGGAFSRPGDSGSAVVDAGGRVVALLFAGSDLVTFAIPIRRVLRRLRVRLTS